MHSFRNRDLEVNFDRVTRKARLRTKTTKRPTRLVTCCAVVHDMMRNVVPARAIRRRPFWESARR